MFWYMFGWLWEVLFPPKCVNCGAWGGYICSRCEVGLWEAEPICPACNVPNPGGKTHSKCQQEDSLEGLVCWWTYEGLARKMLHLAKTRSYHHLLSELVRRGVKLPNPIPQKFLGQKPTVMFVNHSQNQRVFNPAEVVARSLADIKKLRVGIASDQVVLVDDLWVTGKTLRQYCRELKKRGVKRVWGLVLAR